MSDYDPAIPKTDDYGYLDHRPTRADRDAEALAALDAWLKQEPLDHQRQMNCVSNLAWWPGGEYCVTLSVHHRNTETRFTEMAPILADAILAALRRARE